jgi:hypothetical protein
MQLSPPAFERARRFLVEDARPLERALFAHAFEGGDAARIVDALGAYRNEDGGFGHGLEPDLRMPGSSVLATNQALRVLRRAGAPAGHPFVSGAIDWLVSAFDPELGAWRSVPAEAERWPHANHWAWELHADGKRWPVIALPQAEILAHFHAYPGRVPAPLLHPQTRRFVAGMEVADASMGPDALVHCDAFVHTPEAPREAREAIARRIREIGLTMVCRDAEKWSDYVPKPCKLAPLPDSTLARDLAPDVARNLDYEIAQQSADGSWAPYWSWRGAYPEAWAVAEREWRGEVTLSLLESLSAFGRICGIAPGSA